MSEVGQARLQFGVFTLDAGEKSLRRHGQVVPLTPKGFDTLEALVRHAGRLMTKDDLMKEVWPDTFVDDATLAQNISVLRKALHDTPESPQFIETVPKRGYRFVAPVTLEVRTHPAAAVVASSYAAQSPPGSTTAARNWIAAALGLAAVVAALGYAHDRATNTSQPKVMLVVLPFVNLSGDPADEYIADSLTEELTAQLGQLEPDRLGVIARTSAMSFKNSRDIVADIGRKLGVQQVIEGSIRRDDSRLRVTVQLIEVRQQTHTWADNFDADADDLLTMQRNVAQSVVNRIRTQLSVPLTPVQIRAGTAHPRAHQLYLRANYFWNKRDPEQAAKAVALYQQAVGLDPRFARAFAEMSRCYLSFADPTPRESYLKGQAAARKALAIDDTFADAHFSLATASLHLFDWDTAAREFRRAEELDPLMRNYDFAVILGRFDAAIAESRRGIDHDPANFLVHHGLATNLFYARQYAEAIEQFHDALDLSPEHVFSKVRLGQAYGQIGRYDEAVSMLERIGPLAEGSLGYVYGLSGRSTEALVIERKLLDRPGDPPALDLAVVYAGLGRRDAAFTWLNRAYEQLSYQLIYLKVDPRFDSLRSDPRYAELLRRIGFPETSIPQGLGDR
jgi:TolB-like protein/DNA-binding winged helix-turn-helix (wHTH) protein